MDYSEQRTSLGSNEQPFLGLSGSSQLISNFKSDEHDLDKISCSICSSTFKNFSSLKRHFSRLHPTHPLPVRERKKLNFPCQFCHRNFSDERNLKQHVKNSHGFATKKCQRCFFCSIEIGIREFYKHLSQEHSFIVEEEKLEDFPNFSKFQEWKKLMEEETSTKFNLAQTVKKDNRKYHYFICHRSGYFISKSQGKRAPRAKGSCKIDNKCPAKLKVTEVDSGVCTVLFTKSHLGHSTAGFTKVRPAKKNLVRFFRLGPLEKTHP